MPTANIDHLSHMPAAIAALDVASTSHRIPLLQALRDGRIVHFEIARNTSGSVIKQFFKLAEQPTVVLVGDDDHASTGPAGWPIAPKLFGWARVAIIHATDGRPAEYKHAVNVAQKYRRVLFIETKIAHAGAWQTAAAFAGVHRIVSSLPPDGAHPRPAVKP